MYKNRQHPTEAECRLFCCPILLGRCRFCSFLKLLSYRHTPDGVLVFKAKTSELVEYYIREFGASHVGSYDPFRLVIWEDAAQEQYAEKKEIMDGIIKKYHPDWIVKDKPATDGGSGISDQDHAESESHEPQQTPPKKPGDKKGGGGMNPVPPNRRTALKPAQEVKPNEPS